MSNPKRLPVSAGWKDRALKAEAKLKEAEEARDRFERAMKEQAGLKLKAQAERRQRTRALEESIKTFEEQPEVKFRGAEIVEVLEYILALEDSATEEGNKDETTA